MPKLLENEQVIEDATVVDGDAEDISAMQDDIDREMQDIFADVGGDPDDVEFEIRVKKVEKNTGKAAHCFNATPQELPLTERIKDEYGPGIYQIWVYKNGRRFRKRELRIAEMMDKPASRILAENKQDLASLISTMMEQQRQSMQQMQEMLTRQVNPMQQTDQMQQMTLMLGVMNQMKDFLTPQAQGDQFAMFAKGIELARDLVGNGTEKNFHDVILSVIKDVAPPLLEITKRTQQINAPRPPQLGQPTPQQPNPQLTNQTGENQMGAEQQQITEAFRGHVQTLVGCAAKNADPGLWAEVVYEQISPEDLKALVTRPDLTDVLAAYDPNVKKYAHWFDQLKIILVDMMREDGFLNAADTQEQGKTESLTDAAEPVNTTENDNNSGVADNVTEVEPSEPDATQLDSETTPNS